MRWTHEIDAKVTGAREGADDLRALRAELAETQAALEAFKAARGMGDSEPKAGAEPKNPIARPSSTPGDRPLWQVLAVPPSGAAGGKGGGKEKGDHANASKLAADAKKELGVATGMLKAAATAAVAYAGITGAASITQIAIGYQGMARLQAISYRASLDVRRLFTGVDSSPLVRAATQLERNLQKSTVTGNALSGLLTRGFNGFFSLLERAEPYFSAMAQGALLAGLYVEQGILRARLSLMPYTDALEDAIGEQDALELAAYAGGVALAALGVAAATAAAPFILLVGAVGAVAATVRELVKLAKEWDGSSFGQIKAKLGQDLGLTSADDAEKAIQMRARGNYERSEAQRQKAAGAAPQVPAQGAVAAGQALGDGLVKGMGATEAAVKAAGGRLADAADRGVREKAQIHSPSRLFEGRASQMGQGAVRGLEKSEPDVQRAAERSLVPDLRGAVGGGLGAGGRGAPHVQLSITAEFPNVRSGKQDDLRAALEELIPFVTAETVRQLAIALGAGGL